MGCSLRRFAGGLPPRLPRSLPLIAALAAVLVVGGAQVSGSAAATRGDVVHVFTRSPVLVRAGERVLIPVDAVCSTPRGTVCPVTVRLRYRSATGTWRSVGAGASPGLRFETSSLSAAEPSGIVRFRVTASAAGGDVSIPGTGEGRTLSYYVTSDMPTLAVPAIPFGSVSQGRPVLTLPWGTGPGRAGLRPGIESSTLGPSSFDVDASGRVLVTDQLQGRVALFRSGSLVRQTALDLAARTDVALTSGGAAYVSSDPGDGTPITLTKLDASGGVRGRSAVGAPGDALSELRTAGTDAYAHLLPLDAWVSSASAGSSTGMPVGDGGQLLKVVDGNSVRLGTVTGGAVAHPVELRFSSNVGEIALAEPDGAGGYLAVVHLWQDTPTPADQYQVVHVRADDTIATFAVANGGYAETMPLSKFRLGLDGKLYAIQSFPAGARIVRYDLGGLR